MACAAGGAAEAGLVALVGVVHAPGGRAEPGLLAGLADPRLCRALVAIHEAPGRAWSAADLAADLDRRLRGEETLARPLRPLGRLLRRARRAPVSTAMVEKVISL